MVMIKLVGNRPVSALRWNLTGSGVIEYAAGQRCCGGWDSARLGNACRSMWVSMKIANRTSRITEGELWYSGWVWHVLNDNLPELFAAPSSVFLGASYHGLSHGPDRVDGVVGTRRRTSIPGGPPRWETVRCLYRQQQTRTAR